MRDTGFVYNPNNRPNSPVITLVYISTYVCAGQGGCVWSLARVALCFAFCLTPRYRELSGLSALSGLLYRVTRVIRVNKVIRVVPLSVPSREHSLEDYCLIVVQITRIAPMSNPNNPLYNPVDNPLYDPDDMSYISLYIYMFHLYLAHQESTGGRAVGVQLEQLCFLLSLLSELTQPRPERPGCHTPCIHIHTYCLYIYMTIHREKTIEREREREMYMHIYIYIYTLTT